MEHSNALERLLFYREINSPLSCIFQSRTSASSSASSSPSLGGILQNAHLKYIKNGFTLQWSVCRFRSFTHSPFLHQAFLAVIHVKFDLLCRAPLLCNSSSSLPLQHLLSVVKITFQKGPDLIPHSGRARLCLHRSAISVPARVGLIQRPRR